MKLVVFSDLHGNIYTLKEFLLQIKNLEYDYLVFCGDIFGYYYNQQEIIEELRNLDRLIWLKGNHDQYFIDLYRDKVNEKELIKNYGHSYVEVKERYDDEIVCYLEALHAFDILEDKFGKIGIFHGTPGNPLEGRLYPNTEVEKEDEYTVYDMVVLGHTHCRMIRQIENTLVINSGSLGQPRDGNNFGYSYIDTRTREVSFYDIDIEDTLLYQQIQQYDKELLKLREVLDRRHKFEKNFGDSN